MKTKKVRATNVGELMHHYVAAVNKDDRRGDYSYNNDIFYINNYPYCKIVSRKRKIAIIQPFDRTGGWGGGYSHYNLIRSFPKEWTILKTDRLNAVPNKYEEIDKLCLKNIILFTIYNSLKQVVIRYVKEKHLITSNSFCIGYTYKNDISNLTNHISKLCAKLKVSKRDIFRHIYNSTEYIVVSYKGWSNNETVRYKIDKPISFYLNDSKWHNSKEKDVLNFKFWKSKYFNTKAIQSNLYYRQGKTYEQIWKDKEFKANFENSIELGAKQYQIHLDKKKELQRERNLKEKQQQLQLWLTGDNKFSYGLWDIPIHLRIRDNRIETTRNAVIPLESGKLLFQLFNKIRQGSTDKVYNSEKFKVGYYDFNRIEYRNEHWFVVVGCHDIRDTEIDLFINQYNLEEWKQMK